MFMRLGASGQAGSKHDGVNFADLQSGASDALPQNAPPPASDVKSPVPCQGPKPAVTSEASQCSPSHDPAVFYEDTTESPHLDVQDVGINNNETLLAAYDARIERLNDQFDGRKNSSFGKAVLN